MLERNTINELFGITESYEMPDRVMEILMNEKARMRCFNEITKISPDMKEDFFLDYYQEEHGDRKELKQDYTPDCVAVLPRYLYFALQNAMPEFLAKYKSGINLKYEAVKFLKINVPTMEQQKQIIEVLMTIEKAERAEQKEIETLKGFKEGMLEKMFVIEERKG